jgi:hypothetical protein
MNELTDDSVLRALRQLPEVAPDEAFVRAVSVRIRTQRRQLLSLYALLGIAGLAALVLLAPALLQLAGVLAAAPAQVLPLLQSSLLMTLAACGAVITLLWTGRYA